MAKRLAHNVQSKVNRMSTPRQATLDTARQRPTPLVPFPQVRTSADFSAEKAYPPKLGTDSIAIVEGRTFMCSNAVGDVPLGSIGGLLHDDTRYLSRWVLTLADKPLSLLKSGVVDSCSASFFLTNPDLPVSRLRANSVDLRRLRFIGNGVTEQLVARNSTSQPARLELKLGCGADFADLLEVKSAVRDRQSHIVRDQESRALHYIYGVPGFLAETTVRIRRSDIVDPATASIVRNAPANIAGDDIVWNIKLPPRTALVTTLEIAISGPIGAAATTSSRSMRTSGRLTP